MKMQKRLRGMVLAGAALFVAFIAWADTMTVSTYYPSPYGSYQNLDVSNRLGIGTTTPGGRLTIDELSQPTWKGLFQFAGTIFTLKEQNAANTPYPYIEWRDSANARAAYFGWGSKVAPKRLDLFLENGHNLFIGGGGGGGNVGIGTLDPAEVNAFAKLALNSTSNTYLTINAPLAAQSSIAFANTDAGGVIRQDIVLYRPEGTRDFSIWTETNSNSVRVLQNGNVGIGTTVPAAKLDVNGDIHLGSSTGNKQIYTWSAADANWRIGMSAIPGFA